MHLTKEQILQIDNYLKACGIKWYDVRVELVDHIANKIEKRFTENHDLDLKRLLNEEHRNFSPNGFSDVIKSKKRLIKSQFNKSFRTYLKNSLTIPIVILFCGVFLRLRILMILFSNKMLFFNVLSFSLLGFVSVLYLKEFFIKNSKGEKFLILDRDVHGKNKIVFIFFYETVSYINDTSYTNMYVTYARLTIYFLIILYSIAIENVYAKNKKEIEKKYPAIKVAN